VLLLLAAFVPGCSQPAPKAEQPTQEEAQDQPAVVSARPAVTDWASRHAAEGTTPEGTARLWFDAVFRYQNPETRDDGRRGLMQLSIPLSGREDWDQQERMLGFVHRLTEQRFATIFPSYVEGASPENNYQFDPTDWALNISEVRAGRDPTQSIVSVQSSGARAPREMMLARGSQDGLYHVLDFHFLAARLEHERPLPEGG